MQIDSYAFPGTSTANTLKLSAKRYRSGAQETPNRGITLLLAHCIGSHKEQWEPTIEKLFSFASSNSSTTVREIWAFDWQNHGESSLLNQEELKHRDHGVSIYEWAEAIATFVKSSHVSGHRIVAMGHSAGAGTMVLTTKWFPQEAPPYIVIILLEPTIITREEYQSNIEDRQLEMDFAVKGTRKRRATWKSKEDALEWLTPRYPFMLWDPRVVRLYTEHGMYIDQTVVPPVAKLKCDPLQESMSFPQTEPHHEAAIQFGRVCRFTPVHVLWGERDELITQKIQDSLSDVTQGRIAKSVSKVAGAGHLVPQEAPEALAESVFQILGSIGTTKALL